MISAGATESYTWFGYEDDTVLDVKEEGQSIWKGLIKSSLLI